MVPLVLLGMVEFVLRLGGVGFDPHFSSGTNRRPDCYVANEDFGLRFFPRQQARFPPPVVLPATKAPGTFRILFSANPPPWVIRVRTMVRVVIWKCCSPSVFPTKFEVINTSVTAINSHAIPPIARECAGHAGDLWIVYMGNNDGGTVQAVTVFGAQSPKLWLVRTQLELRRLRLAQLLLATVEKLQAKPAADSRWQGMEMFCRTGSSPRPRHDWWLMRISNATSRTLCRPGGGGCPDRPPPWR